jgi:eukaryotic-like serine/threonine-protein kinase
MTDPRTVYSSTTPEPAPEERLAQLWQRGRVQDVDRFLAGVATLPAPQLALVLVIDQWHRWNRGEHLSAENYLQRYPAVGADRESALAVVYGEFLLREERGESPAVDEYLQRFPHLASRFSQQVHLHRALDEQAPTATHPIGASDTSEPAVPTAPSVAGYEILSELGRGNMGVVYRAHQTRLRRQVALKMVLAAAGATPDELARFRTEAEAIARLQHPNIVQVYEFGEDDGRLFFSMELVEGGTLAQLTSAGPLPVARAAELIATLARAIDYAHSRGVVHRDLKPANILLDRGAGPGTRDEGRGARDEEEERHSLPSPSPLAPRPSPLAPRPSPLVPKITDFGLAKLLVGGAGQTASGTLLGTPAYMPPEQAGMAGGAVGPAADTYALGAILYELLTGRPPFWADSAVDTLLQVRTLDPIPPGRLHPGIPRDLEVICLKCLEKSPSQRYASAAELADDLERFLRHEPIRARPLGRLPRLARWCRRHPARAGALLGLIAVAMLSVSFLVYYIYAADQLGRALGESDRLNAGLALDRGQSLCEQGDIAPGLLWLSRSLELAAKCDDAALERAIRINLSAWAARMHPLRGCLQHSGRVRTIAFSPDGKLLATGCADGTARLWDMATGNAAGPTLKNSSAVTSVAFCLDGKQLVCGCADGTALRWDTADGTPVEPALEHGASIERVLVDAQGQWCVTVGGASAGVWEAATGKRLATLAHDAAVTAAVFSADGGTLLTAAEDGRADFWEVPRGARRGWPLRHTRPVRAVAVQAGGKLVALGDADGHVTLWDRTTARPVREGPRHAAAVSVVAFRPDGKLLLSAGRDWRVRLWDVDDPKAVEQAVLPHLGPVHAASFSPDGAAVLTGSQDGRGRLWDAARGTQIHGPLLFQAEVHLAVFSPDGRSVAVAGNDDVVRMWGFTAPAAVLPEFDYPEGIYVAAFNPDGTLLATAGEGDELCPIRLWDTATLKQKQVLPGHPRTVRAIAFSSDGKQLVSGGGDGTGRIWDVATADEVYRTAPPAQGWVSAVALTPDGSTLLTGTQEGEVHLWDTVARKHRTQFSAHNGLVLNAAFSPDGSRFLTGSTDLTARLGPVAGDEPLSAPLRHQGQVWSVTFSPDGRLALTGSDDRTVRAWDAVTGVPVGAPLVDPHMTRLVVVSPDGQVILKGGMHDASRLWDAATRKPLGPPIVHPGKLVAARVAPDGQRLQLAGERMQSASLGVVLAPIAGEPARVRLWAHLATGMDLAADDGLRVLDVDQWQERRQRLAEFGPPPR